MAVRWRLQFKSIGDTSYKVNIYDSTYSGSPKELKGGAVPFETVEDYSDNPLMPVRISTGTINIINTGTLDESDIMPTTPKGRFVTLTNASDVVLWQGYIKQEQFTQQWDREPYELSFPVMSSLGILEGAQIIKGEVDARARIAEYIRLALSKTGATYNRIFFPNDLAQSSGASYDVFFRIGMQDRNWFTYKNENVVDKTASRYDGVTWMELLSELMTSFGYALYEKGTDIYILSRQSQIYSYINFSTLTNLAANGSVTLNGVSRTNINIANLQIADASGRMSVALPSHRAVIEAAINPFGDDSTPQINSMYLDYSGKVQVTRNYAQGTGAYFDKELATYSPIAGQSIWTFKSYASGVEQTWNAQDITRDFHIGAFVRDMDGTNLILINYDNTNDAEGYGGTWTVAVKSATSTFLAGGRLRISGNIDIYEGEGSTLNHRGVFMLRCGSYYYDVDNNTWTTTQKTFQTTIDQNSGAIGFLSTNNMGEDNGFYITLPTNGIFGDVELFFFDPVSTSFVQGLQATYLFRNLKVEYVGPTNDLFKDYPETDTNRFVEDLNTYAQEDNEKNINITSYINNRMGYGVLLSPDLGSPLSYIFSRIQGTIYFEQHLLRAITVNFQNSQKILEIPIRRAEQFIPLDDFYYQASYLYLANRINWRDEKQMIKIYKT